MLLMRLNPINTDQVHITVVAVVVVSNGIASAQFPMMTLQMIYLFVQLSNVKKKDFWYVLPKSVKWNEG